MPANSQRLEILSGWKEIALYLGKGVRTIQRYERELGLPVRRPAGKPRSSVIATKAELDGWVIASPIREAFQLSPSTVDNHAPLQEFHLRVKELHRLQTEAAQLREDLTRSLNLLRANVAALSEQRSVLPSSAERRLLADVLTFDPKKEKAN